MILRCFPSMYTLEATQGNALFSRITSPFLITKLRLDEELEITLFIKQNCLQIKIVHMDQISPTKPTMLDDLQNIASFTQLIIIFL